MSAKPTVPTFALSPIIVRLMSYVSHKLGEPSTLNLNKGQIGFAVPGAYCDNCDEEHPAAVVTIDVSDPAKPRLDVFVNDDTHDELEFLLIGWCVKNGVDWRGTDEMIEEMAARQETSVARDLVPPKSKRH